jgi:hypothetical protein
LVSAKICAMNESLQLQEGQTVLNYTILEKLGLSAMYLEFLIDLKKDH